MHVTTVESYFQRCSRGILFDAEAGARAELFSQLATRYLGVYKAIAIDYSSSEILLI